jgi:transposase-like protein
MRRDNDSPIQGWREVMGGSNVTRSQADSGSSDHRDSERREAVRVLLRSKKFKIITVCRLLGVSRPTVFRWRRQWFDRSA